MNLRCYIWRSMLYSFFINSINLTHNLSSPPSFLCVTRAENSWKKLLFKSRGTSVLCTGAEHWCYTSVFAVCGVTPVFSLALSLTLTLNTGNMTSRNGRLSLYTRDSADCRETGDTNPMPFFEFKASVSLALLNARKSRKRLGRISLQDQEHAAGSKRGGPKTVLTTPDIRLDEMNH